jgi:hypothetical protein
LPAFLLVLLFAGTATVALAHGEATAGDYQLVIGFLNEPAYQGEPNGLELTVTNSKTGEKINNLTDTLKVAVSYGSISQTLQLQPVAGQDGSYTAPLLPTAAGDYTWQITGNIRDTPVNVNMTSGPDTFGAVQAKSTIAFPAEQTITELQTQAATLQTSADTLRTQSDNLQTQANDLKAEVTTLQTQVAAAQQAAQQGQIIGAIGILLGVIGTVVGFLRARVPGAARVLPSSTPKPPARKR